MGLVIAPPLSVLPVVSSPDSAPPAPQDAGTTGTGTTDTFADLLAMLAQMGATVAAPGKPTADAAAVLPGLPLATAKPDEDRSSDSSPAAALAAALLLPIAAPVLPDATAADAATSAATSSAPTAATFAATSSAPTAATSASTTSAPTAAALPTSGAAPEPPMAALLPGGSPEISTSELAPQTTPDSAPISATVDTETPATTPLPAGVNVADIARSMSVSAATEGIPLAPSPIPGAPDAGLVSESPADAQPPGANAPQGVEVSVVRSVGNASQMQTSGEATQGHANLGQKHEAASPTPEAQSASSAIAVAPTLANGSAAPAAPTAQAAAPVHTPPQPVEQVARAVIDRAEQGGGEVHIRLDPPELGAVTIHVRIEGNRVQVQVQVERSEAMNLLRQSTIDLSSLLGSRGLNLTDVNVGFGGGQAQGQEEPGANRASGGSNGEFASILGVNETPATELHNRLQSAYNPDGRHLYRV